MERTTFVRVSLILMSLLACPWSQCMEQPPVPVPAASTWSDTASQLAQKISAAGSRAKEAITQTGAYKAVAGYLAGSAVDRGFTYAWQKACEHPVIAATTAVVAVGGAGYLAYRKLRSNEAEKETEDTECTDEEVEAGIDAAQDVENLTKLIETLTTQQARIESCVEQDVAKLLQLADKAYNVVDAPKGNVKAQDTAKDELRKLKNSCKSELAALKMPFAVNKNKDLYYKELLPMYNDIFNATLDIFNKKNITANDINAALDLVNGLESGLLPRLAALKEQEVKLAVASLDQMSDAKPATKKAKKPAAKKAEKPATKKTTTKKTVAPAKTEEDGEDEEVAEETKKETSVKSEGSLLNPVNAVRRAWGWTKSWFTSNKTEEDQAEEAAEEEVKKPAAKKEAPKAKPAAKAKPATTNKKKATK